ncbi:unnamed protein product [Heligmosomoides polygyrus]|uniref:Uncharacterized protein n=1 Tax=Heligmosomoides polygyrus TaxID=6339 RepID=A0A183GNH3_HELPZ|nr:unnamed protein product [Heligmosomoides polygyrus]
MPACEEGTESRLTVMETLRWTVGVLHLNRVRNYPIQKKLNVVLVADMLHEARLRRCVYALFRRRKKEDDMDSFMTPEKRTLRESVTDE